MTNTKFLQLIEILGGKDNLHQNIIEAEKNSEYIKNNDETDVLLEHQIEQTYLKIEKLFKNDKKETEKLLNQYGFNPEEIQDLVENITHYDEYFRASIREYYSEKDKNKNRYLLQHSSVADIFKNRKSLKNGHYFNFVNHVVENLLPKQKAEMLALFSLYISSGEIYESRTVKSLYEACNGDISKLIGKQLDGFISAINIELEKFETNSNINSHCLSEYKNLPFIGTVKNGVRNNGGLSGVTNIETVKDKNNFLHIALGTDQFITTKTGFENNAIGFRIAESAQNSLDGNWIVGSDKVNFEKYSVLVSTNPLFYNNNSHLGKLVDSVVDDMGAGVKEKMKESVLRFNVDSELLSALSMYSSTKYERLRKNISYVLFANNSLFEPKGTIAQFNESANNVGNVANVLRHMIEKAPSMMTIRTEIKIIYKHVLDNYTKIISSPYKKGLGKDFDFIKESIEKLEKLAKQNGLDNSNFYLSAMNYDSPTPLNKEREKEEKQILSLIRERNDNFTKDEINIMKNDILVRSAETVIISNYIHNNALTRDSEIAKYLEDKMSELSVYKGKGNVWNPNSIILKMIDDKRRGYERPFLSKYVVELNQKRRLERSPELISYLNEIGETYSGNKTEIFKSEYNQKQKNNITYYTGTLGSVASNKNSILSRLNSFGENRSNSVDFDEIYTSAINNWQVKSVAKALNRFHKEELTVAIQKIFELNPEYIEDLIARYPEYTNVKKEFENTKTTLKA